LADRIGDPACVGDRRVHHVGRDPEVRQFQFLARVASLAGGVVEDQFRIALVQAAEFAAE
jgi:hypothetical protein